MMGSYAKETERRLNHISGDLFQVVADVKKNYTGEELRAFAPLLVRLTAMACEVTEIEDWCRELLPLTG